MSNNFEVTPTILRRDKVQARTGLSRSSIYQMMAEGRFPKPISIGARAVGWLEASINGWIEDRINTTLSAQAAGQKRRGKFKSATAVLS